MVRQPGAIDGLLIPVDINLPISAVSMAKSWEAMRDAIGGPCQYIERVRTRLTQPHLGNLVLVVDEMGLYHEWTRNARASALYAPGVFPGIMGPALLFREQQNLLDGADFASVRGEDIAVVTDYLMQTVR